MDATEAFDPRDFVQLPGDGPWVPRFGRPCRCCGSGVFEVVRVRRRLPVEGKPDQFRDAVESRCPRCPLLTDRLVVKGSRVLLGHHDPVAGTLTLLDEAAAA